MLRRKEILMALRKLGFDKISELKIGCRDYEKYFQSSVERQVVDNRRQQVRSLQ